MKMKNLECLLTIFDLFIFMVGNQILTMVSQTSLFNLIIKFIVLQHSQY